MGGPDPGPWPPEGRGPDVSPGGNGGWGQWPGGEAGSGSEGSPRGEVSAGEGTGGGSQRSAWELREGGEGPRKGQGEPWGGVSRLRGWAQWATYPAGGPDTVGPRAHPRGLRCRLRSPGLHPGPSTAVGASVWDRTAGAPGGWGGNARTPSELIRPVASLGDVFCVEKSQDTSLYSAECAWRPALHVSPPGLPLAGQQASRGRLQVGSRGPGWWDRAAEGWKGLWWGRRHGMERRCQADTP